MASLGIEVEHHRVRQAVQHGQLEGVRIHGSSICLSYTPRMAGLVPSLDALVTRLGLAPHEVQVFDPAHRFLFNSYYDAVGARHPRPMRGLLTRPPAARIAAYRAANRLTELRKSLDDWYKHFDGYDPLFTWWNRAPYKALTEDLDGYVKFLREKVVGVEPEKVFIPAPMMDDIWLDRVNLEGDVAALRPREVRSYENAASVQALSQSNMRLAQSLIQRLNPQLHHWNHNTVFAIDRMRDDFGFVPDYTFQSAVEQTYDWFMSQGLDKVRQYDFGWEDTLIEAIRSR